MGPDSEQNRSEQRNGPLELDTSQVSSQLADRCLAICPARGGSRGIRRKNSRELAGHPLLSYTLDCARAAGLERVVLTTDDRDIARLGRSLGFDVPFLRPAELASDTSPMVPVLLHCLQELRELGDAGGECEYVLLLQPTSPLRRVESIVRALELIEAESADSVVSVCRVPDEHNPHWVYEQAQGGELSLVTGAAEPIPRRQDLPAAFHREGSIYVVRRTVLEARRSLYGSRMLGIEIEAKDSVNLDTPDDWQRAERLLAQRNHDEPTAQSRPE